MDPRVPRVGPQALNLLLRPRPKHDLIGQKGKKETITPSTSDTLVFMSQCQDCDVTLQTPAVKVIIDRCQSAKINVNARIISGLIEVIASTNITLIIQEDIQVKFSRFS